MSKKILQLEFTLTVPLSEVAPMFEQAAKAISDVRGLAWKIWLSDETQRKGGGIYLFDDDASRQAYLGGPIVGQLRALPGVKDIVARQFDVVDDLSLVTRGPV